MIKIAIGWVNFNFLTFLSFNLQPVTQKNQDMHCSESDGLSINEWVYIGKFSLSECLRQIHSDISHRLEMRLKVSYRI